MLEISCKFPISLWLAALLENFKTMASQKAASAGHAGNLKQIFKNKNHMANNQTSRRLRKQTAKIKGKKLE
ncbi:MAG: hypothetical protein DRN04_14220 [Thermoprotei archaeon]|nr:MAG: hypothetical protein DRN04_14220 [Thermoprotei archaeon]